MVFEGVFGRFTDLYSVMIRERDTINGASERFRYILPYLRVFLEGSRSDSVIMGESPPRDSGVEFRQLQ